MSEVLGPASDREAEASVEGAPAAPDADQLARWLRLDVLGPILSSVLGSDHWLRSTPVLIPGGKSNLTFELISDAGSVIVRRPPLGAILDSAHDMGREARVQTALGKHTSVPVPRILYADVEGAVIGTPVYVMEKVSGTVIRDDLPPLFATTDAEKVALAGGLIDALAALHAVDPVAVGLGDYGRPVGFVERQIGRWTAQWEQSKVEGVPEIDELARRLRRALPPATERFCIVHGDFRLDNCLMDLSAPGRVAAVLDWELSTLGDPMTDLALLLFYWCEAGEPVPLLTPAITQQPGFPKRSHLIERYISATGASPEHLAFFEGFAHFKSAVIAQGIATRVAAGAMAGQEFGDIETEVARIAAEGLARLRGSP